MSNTSLRLSDTVPKNIDTSGIPDIYMEALLQFLVSSPYILCTVTLSYVSGHLWAYIILSYFSKKERKILYSLVGKLSLGLMWFAVILIPTYLFTFKSANIVGEQLLEIIITVLAMGLALQLLVLFAVFILYRKG